MPILFNPIQGRKPTPIQAVVDCAPIHSYNGTTQKKFGFIYFRLAQPNRHSEREKRAWDSPTEQHARRLPQSLCSFAMTDKPKVYNPEKIKGNDIDVDPYIGL